MPPLNSLQIIPVPAADVAFLLPAGFGGVDGVESVLGLHVGSR